MTALTALARLGPPTGRSTGSAAGRRMGAAAAGIGLDALLGEPPVRPHPVSAFGTVMRVSEARLWRDRRLAGVAHATAGLTLGMAAGRMLRSTTAATYLAVAGRALDGAASEVGDALASGDLDRARRLLPALVGRDPEGLDAGEIARAVIESVAENTVDAVIAPAFWGAVAGAPGALGYRAVNTLDALVGHRSPRHLRFGWASARLDDLANLVPARVTALLVVLVRPSSGPAVWRAVRRDAPAHPSPNSGVAEAAFAAALGIRLGGRSRYGDRVEQRPQLGTGRPATPADIADARRLAQDVAAGAAGLMVVSSAVLASRRSPGGVR